MIEYPTIINSSKAPRKMCYAFDKIDGSNIRIKYTEKNGFTNFGSRHELFDETHPLLGEVVSIFNREHKTNLEKLLKKNFRNVREIIVFCEFFGEKSFAGLHFSDDPKKLIFFDALIGHKNQEFLKPKEFIKLFDGIVEIPKVVYIGNLNDEFIKDVRDNKYNLNEGVVCKGVETNSRDQMWMCKIKTNAYFQKLKERFSEDYLKYWE